MQFGCFVIGDKVKILIIVPSLRDGGAQKIASKLSSSLINNEHVVRVVTFDPGRVDFPVDYHIDLSIKSNAFPILRLINVLKRVYFIKIIKNRYKPDISLSFLFSANLVNILSKSKNQLTITSVHNSLISETGRNYMKILNRLIYWFSDKVVAVSKGIKNELIESYSVPEKKIKVIYNFINVETAINLRHRNNVTKIITIGRLIEQKAQWHLIHMMDKLRETFPVISLEILGDGPLSDNYMKLVDELNLRKNIVFLGFRDDVDKYLHESDIFILTSKNEGLPVAIIEAMNMGLPIISTDIPHGPKEILNLNGVNLYTNDEILLDDKYGLLVDYGNNKLSSNFGFKDEYIIKQLVEKATLLIKNRDIYQYYSKQSKKRALFFSEDNIIQDWLNLFNGN